MRGTRVLVTDGEQRASLAIIRSLGRSGCRVEVASVSGRSLAGASRHARADHPLPDPLTDPTRFAEGLEETVRVTGAEILIPVTEPSLLAALPHRDAFDCLLPFPDLQRFRRASDKGEVARLAREVDIAVPDQVEVPGCDADVELPGNPEASYVLKPSRSVEGGRKLGVSYSRGGSKLREALAGLPDEAFPVLVQQRILGSGAGVFLLVWDGEPRAVFGHRRIREKPPSGGVSVVRESALVDSALAESATRLLRRLQWHGVAMVEFKIDGDTGTPFLMEINGRFWGSLQLAIDAGVDFPRLLVEAATGSGSHPVPSYRPGVRCRWLLGDLDQLLVRLRRSPEALNLPPGMPGRGRAIAEFVRDFFPPNRLEVLRLRDPQPFFREVRLWLQELAGGKTRNQD